MKLFIRIKTKFKFLSLYLQQRSLKMQVNQIDVLIQLQIFSNSYCYQI